MPEQFMNPHLWQGIWLDDAELERRLPELPKAIDAAQRQPFELRHVLDACERLSRRLMMEDDSVRHALIGSLKKDMDEAEATEKLVEIAEFISRRELEQKVLREMGSLDPFTLARCDYKANVFEQWAPVGFVVHIAPGNAFSVGAFSVLEGLLTGNINFLKTSGQDESFSQLFLKALIDADRSATIAPRVFACRISSQEQERLRGILSHADAVSAWGDETAISSVRAISPPLARFIDWGPKISFAYFAADRLRDQDALRALAKECCLLEQQACSSPQCVYVETEDKDELRRFARQLADCLEVVSPTVPRKRPGLHEQAEITSVVELARLESCLDLSEVIEGPDRDWRVLVDFSSSLRASPLFRTIWVKPMRRDAVVRTLKPMRAYLQTAGVACGISSFQDVCAALVGAGVLRITQVGGMLDSYAGEPHDGVYALQRYARRISAQLSPEFASIASFAELAPVAQSPPDVPILSKAQFQEMSIDPEYAHLFFRSGGSSGEPKLSIFSYSDYHHQMRAAAEGLLAAGLDPKHDRCMNVFFGGGLYGGFISFFTILETLQAIQFPMAGYADMRMVAQTIVSKNINVLLGMPSYLIQLFSQNADLFRQNKVVEKIFYGGEHFSESQKRYFEREFGVKVIRSATYGSVDAGPIGFQCTACTGSVHHLHTRLHLMEILELGEDAPVVPGQMGRVILTSLVRSGQRVERYDIGDLARAVPGDCKCGRKSPRFELLGRHGDVFRIGTMFLNYTKFANILTDRFDYAGEVQIVLRPGEHGAKERVSVLLTGNIDPSQVHASLLDEYADLKLAVEEDALLDLTVDMVAPDKLERTAGSGKLKRIIDERLMSRNV